jgi:hypothetical protein
MGIGDLCSLTCEVRKRDGLDGRGGRGGRGRRMQQRTMRRWRWWMRCGTSRRWTTVARHRASRQSSNEREADNNRDSLAPHNLGFGRDTLSSCTPSLPSPVAHILPFDTSCTLYQTSSDTHGSHESHHTRSSSHPPRSRESPQSTASTRQHD